MFMCKIMVGGQFFLCFFKTAFLSGNSWHRERRSPLCPGRDGCISKRNTKGYAAFKTHNPKDLPSKSQLAPGSVYGQDVT